MVGRRGVFDQSVEQNGEVLIRGPRGTANKKADTTVENGIGKVRSHFNVLQEGLALLAVANGLEDLGGTVVHGLDRGLDVVGSTQQVVSHGVSDGKICTGGETTEQAFVSL